MGLGRRLFRHRGDLRRRRRDLNWLCRGDGDGGRVPRPRAREKAGDRGSGLSAAAGTAFAAAGIAGASAATRGADGTAGAALRVSTGAGSTSDVSAAAAACRGHDCGHGRRRGDRRNRICGSQGGSRDGCNRLGRIRPYDGFSRFGGGGHSGLIRRLRGESRLRRRRFGGFVHGRRLVRRKRRSDGRLDGGRCSARNFGFDRRRGARLFQSGGRRHCPRRLRHGCGQGRRRCNRRDRVCCNRRDRVRGGRQAGDFVGLGSSLNFTRRAAQRKKKPCGPRPPAPRAGKAARRESGGGRRGGAVRWLWRSAGRSARRFVAARLRACMHPRIGPPGLRGDDRDRGGRFSDCYGGPKRASLPRGAPFADRRLCDATRGGRSSDSGASRAPWRRLPNGRRFPGTSVPVPLTAFVLPHRCGAVPDFHRVPF